MAAPERRPRPPLNAFRNRLRAPGHPQTGRGPAGLSQDRQVAELPPTSILQLAAALKEAGDPATTVSPCPATPRYPDDVWINYHLAEGAGRITRGDARRCVTTPRAGRPRPGRHNLGHLLDQMGRAEDAIATFRAARQKVRPAEARNIGCLGTVLLGQHHRDEGMKAIDEAIAAARETIRRRPGDAGEHSILGHLLAVRGDQDGAIAAYREALRIRTGPHGRPGRSWPY